MLAAVLLATLGATLAWGLFGPEPAIVVSPTTTFLTAPCAADGLPDYEAALIASAAPLPSAEENVAAELLLTFWPFDVSPDGLREVCAAVGVPPTPPAGALARPHKDRDANISYGMFVDARQRPWTGTDFPAVEAWFVRHATPLDRVVAATDRPRYWLPHAALVNGRPDPLYRSVNILNGVLDVAQVLHGRAMWHRGAGRYAEAWRDIRAILRLGRSITTGESGPSMFFAVAQASALEQMAARATIEHLVGSPTVPGDVIATIRRDLDALGPPAGPEAAIESGRIQAIDIVIWLARRQPEGRSARVQEIDKLDVGLFGRPVVLETMPWTRAALRTSLDWNVVLAHFNTLGDRYAAACRLPTYRERHAAASLLDTEVLNGPAMPAGTTVSNATGAILFATSRHWRSDRVGTALVRILSDGSTAAFLAKYAESRARFEMTRTAAALAAWRADQPPGTPPYPDRLDALVPKYLAAVPLDPFTDEPLIYERRGDGYLMASTGRDGVYDGGDDVSGRIVRGEWQDQPGRGGYDRTDIVVRIPIPQPVAAPADR
ncbi:hypothetical protein LBMAG47_31760 [Planctomycetia bacterium]|nr:hypothetical protein LBMAG47_31760 [Planctomycetia bacterium]